MVIASDIMTSRLVTVHEDEDLYQALYAFRRENHDVLTAIADRDVECLVGFVDGVGVNNNGNGDAEGTWFDHHLARDLLVVRAGARGSIAGFHREGDRKSRLSAETQWDRHNGSVARSDVLGNKRWLRLIVDHRQLRPCEHLIGQYDLNLRLARPGVPIVDRKRHREFERIAAACESDRKG